MSISPKGQFPGFIRSVAQNKREDWLERIAIGASLLCLVHCLLLPLIIAVIPTLSLVLDLPESFHLVMLGLATPSSITALLIGRPRHGRFWPLAIGIAGILSLAIAALFLAETVWELRLTVIGSLALGAAHAANWRLRHRH